MPFDPWSYYSADAIAAATGCPPDAVRANWPLVAAALDTRGLLNQAMTICSVGTIAIETASTFRPIHEFGTPADWAGYDGGAAYAGAGFAQITHLYNFRACGAAIGLDLVNHPELLLVPGPSAASFAWFVATHGVPSKDGSHYYTLAELADEGDDSWFRQVWNGSTNGLDRMLAVRAALDGAAVTTDRLYSVDVPDSEILQQNKWTCAVRSTYSALWAMAQVGDGPPVSYDTVYSWMVPSIDTSDRGLHYGDGHELVALLQAQGYPAHAITNATIGQAQARAGLQPLLIGGAGWGHWVYCKGLEADGTLILENPAPGYDGIGGELRDHWATLGPMTVIFLDKVAPPAPAPGPSPEPKPEPEPVAPPTDDHLRTLVGVAYHPDGTVVPALKNATKEASVEPMRQQVQAVVSFLTDNNPDK